jgi:integrating conjugative element protein (TIGR03749 family)
MKILGQRRIAAAMVFVVALGADIASAATVVWRKTPLNVDLVVGVEQMVVLPRDGAVGLPPELGNTNVFRTLVTGGTAYWTALEPFEAKRIKVRLDSGEYVLFDVSARTQKSPPAAMDVIQVVMSGESSSSALGGDGAGRDGVGRDRMSPATLFELIRYAAQELYSPARLVAPVPGVRPAPVGLKGNMTVLYDQGRHRGLVVQPYKAWAVDGLYVTAFIVTNEHSHRMILDNRKVRHAPSAHRNGVAPHFVASAFFETELAPRGNAGNRTTLFIVTDQPIRSVVRGT